MQKILYRIERLLYRLMQASLGVAALGFAAWAILGVFDARTSTVITLGGIAIAMACLIPYAFLSSRRIDREFPLR